jgi:SAM-dependent methyltransferase
MTAAISAKPMESSSPVYGASKHYLGKQGEEYFKWQSGTGHFGARINAHKFRHLVKESDTVIDFGCGGGFLLARLNCQRRLGVEINPAARKHAHDLGIECFASAEDVPDGIADLIISDHALEHVPYPIGALTTLRHKLKPAGLLSICVPIDNWRRERRYDRNDQNHHLHTWTPQLLGSSLFEAGFEVKSIHARIFAWPGRWTVACYGRLPYSVFRAICFSYGWMTGTGWEILAVAEPRT